MRDIGNINLLPRPQTLQWTTRSGEVIPITAMDDDHLMNAYRLCMRQERDCQRWEDILSKEAKRRGIPLKPTARETRRLCKPLIERLKKYIATVKEDFRR